MDEREQLEQAIAALEAQRALLGDAVVDAALAPMREKLATLLAQPTARESEQRKQVTVLFADVSGFTAMSETLDAEEVSGTMNALWTRLDGAVLAHGGRIDKHIGDAVMALFGAPVAHEDDPERAIRAALDMLVEIAAFNTGQGAPLRLPVPLQMRIGINTGPVLLGAVGTTGEYTAMGDTVNLASRLEHAAPVGGILISHDTYRHVRGVFDVQPLEPISVKGKAEPVQTYVVRAAKPRAFRVTTRGVEGIETRTIGREAELQQMQAAYQAAHAGRTQLVNIVAEAGTGKSRLLYEFGNWLEMLPQRTLLFRGRATLERAKLPYALVRDVLAARFEIQDSDRAAVAREKLERGLVDFMGDDGLEAAHFIGHLIGFDFSSSPHLQGILGDARQIHDRAFHYAARFFEAVSRTDVTVLMLEDIHWADAGSLDLFDAVLHERPDVRLLILAATRLTLFEERPTWGEGPMAHLRLDLQPLSEQHSRRLVDEILKKVPQIPPALQDLIVQRAEGSPFYVEELIKMLIEDGVIVPQDDRWEVELERLAQVRVPATLTGILQARLDGLPPPERETLQQASVVGRVFWENVVERLQQVHATQVALREEAHILHARLNALRGKELIFQREASAFAEVPEYIFKHAILHDVTYESVLKRLRRAYHAQVAESLKELSGERVEEYAGRIGEHYERAGEWAHAAEWYGRAGQQAQSTYAPEAAIGYYHKALAFWKESGGSSDARSDWLADIHDGLGAMLIIQARHAEALETYTTMRAQAEAAGDLRAQSRAWYGLAQAQVYQGDTRAALESAEKAGAVAEAASAKLERVKALWTKSWISYLLGEVETARTLGERLLVMASDLDDQGQMVSRVLNVLGAVHNMLGQYDQAQQRWENALQVCQERGDRQQVMNLLNNLGVIAEARGDYGAAFTRYEEALRIAHAIGDRDGELTFLSNVGAARVGRGDFRAAETDLREVIRMAGTSGSGVLPNTYYFLAEACLGQGQAEAALDAARQALALGQAGEIPEYIAAAWRALGMVAAHLPEPIAINDKETGQPKLHDTTACLTESLRICTEMGMEGERARTLRAWAEYELKRGDRARGAAMWQEAREIFARLGADLEAARMGDAPSAD